jgi:hypothetical protein
MVGKRKERRLTEDPTSTTKNNVTANECLQTFRGTSIHVQETSSITAPSAVTWKSVLDLQSLILP